MKNNDKKMGFSSIGKGLTRNEMKNINGGDIVVPPTEKNAVCIFYCSPCPGVSSKNCKTTGECC